MFVSISEMIIIVLGVRRRCSVHLINEGITSVRNAAGKMVTVIEWGLSAPSDSEMMPSQISFVCTLDRITTFSCKYYSWLHDSLGFSLREVN